LGGVVFVVDEPDFGVDALDESIGDAQFDRRYDGLEVDL
jgi:hypothetical protein